MSFRKFIRKYGYVIGGVMTGIGAIIFGGSEVYNTYASDKEYKEFLANMLDNKEEN